MMNFEGKSGATNGFELPGAAPSADTAFKDDVAHDDDVTIAAAQTFNNGQ